MRRALVLGFLAVVGCGEAAAPPSPPTTVTRPTPPVETRTEEARARPPGPVPRLRIGTGTLYSTAAARAIAVDGDTVVVGRDGPRIEIWRDGTRVMNLDLAPPAAATGGVGTGGTGPGGVQALALSATRIAIALGGHGLRVFDRITGAEVFSATDVGVVHDVALLPDGSVASAHGGEAYANGHLIVEASGPCGLCVWSPTGTRSFTRAAADAGGWVTAIAASTDGATIVTGASDGRLRVHDATGTVVREIRAGTRRIERVVLTDEGRSLVHADDSGGIGRVGLDGSGRRSLFSSDEVTTAVALGETRLAWANDMAGVSFLDGAGDRLGRVYLDGPSALAIDGDDVLVGDYRGHVRRWRDGAFAFPEDPQRVVDDVFWDGERIVVRAGTELRVYRSTDGGLESGPRVLPDFTAATALRPEGRLVVQTNAISLREEDLVDGANGRSAGSGGGSSINHLSTSANRSVLAYATIDRIRVGSASVRVEDGINAMALSPDGSEIVVASQGALPTLAVLVVASGETRWSVTLDHAASLLAWRGTTIAVGYGGSATPELRDPADGARRFSINVLVGAEGTPALSALAMSVDGERVGFGLDDGTVAVTAARSAERLLQGSIDHHGPVTSIAFSPDHTEVASGSADGTVLVWTPRTPEL